MGVGLQPEDIWKIGVKDKAEGKPVGLEQHGWHFLMKIFKPRLHPKRFHRNSAKSEFQGKTVGQSGGYCVFCRNFHQFYISGR
jgi:hypothetical protein